jgi:hypothetical protein
MHQGTGFASGFSDVIVAPTVAEGFRGLIQTIGMGQVGTQSLFLSRSKMVLERWANPRLLRRSCTCEYGLQS